MAPRFSSPAIGAGDVSLAVDENGQPLAYDQRGPGHPRVVVGRVDLGAVQSRPESPLHLVVNDPGDGPLSGYDTDIDPAHLTLRQAIHLANASYFVADTITLDVPAGTTITPTRGEFTLADPVTIAGPGADRLTLCGGNTSRIFHINDEDDYLASAFSIRGLTLPGGRGDLGGAILMEGAVSDFTFPDSLDLTDMTLAGNTASVPGAQFSSGGAIDPLFSILTLTHTTLTGNSAPGADLGVVGEGGAISAAACPTTITGCVVSGNSALVGGGGIFHFGGPMTITDSTICGNTVSGYGAGVYAGGTLVMTDCSVTGNSAGLLYGGLYMQGDPTDTATLTGCTFSGNTALACAGILNMNFLTMTNRTLSGNTATYSGTDPSIAPDVVAPYAGAALTNWFNATVINRTLADSTSAFPNGGTLFTYDGSRGNYPGLVLGGLTLNNTIVSGADTRIVVGATGTLTGSHNLIEGASPAGLTGTITAAPLLAPLGDYARSRSMACCMAATLPCSSRPATYSVPSTAPAASRRGGG
jgi:hypothetical protein